MARFRFGVGEIRCTKICPSIGLRSALLMVVIYVKLLMCDQSKFLNVTRIFLRFLGIWSEEGSLLVTRIACTLSITAYMIVGAISFLYRTDENIITYAVTLTMFGYGFISLIKALWFFYNSKKIGWLVNELERISIKHISDDKSHKMEFIKAENISQVLTKLLLFMLSIVLALETLNCLFLSNNDSRMMFNLYSFIDPTRYYFLALAFQYFCWIWTIPIFIITLNLLMCFSMLCVANISVLEDYLKSAPLNLSRTVNLHTDIIRIVKVMNEVLRPAIICDLTMGSIIACISAYIGVKGITLQEKGTFYIALFCEFVLSWFICHCGSILEEKSKTLPDAVYSSRWIELKPKQRKEIIILMIASKKPSQIKLSCTHIINYTYFTSFIQITYSFFTLLLSINSH